MIKSGISKKTYWYSRELMLIVLLLLLISSFLLYLFNDEKKRKIILYFPEDNLTDIAGDYHIVPIRNNVEDNMEMTLREALLRPFDYRLNPIVPENVKINSFIYNHDEKRLFIDLSIDMILVDSNNPRIVDGQLMLDLLEKNLFFNHRFLKKIQFSIDGEVPFTPVFLPNNE